MQVCSFEFVLAVTLLAAVYFLLPSALWKQLLLGALNACCIYLLMPNWESAATLGLVLLSGYWAGRYLKKHPHKAVFGCSLVLLVAAFAYLKQYSFLQRLLPPSAFSDAISTVGLSYILFRQIHFLVDQYQGAEEKLSLWWYLNYQLNIFSLLSGPITRYHEFQKDWGERQPLWDTPYDLLKAYGRIWLGVIKIAIISAWLWELYQKASPLWAPGNTVPSYALIRFGMMFYLYPLYIYFNFSGYCDIVIGCGYLFGLRIPENFDFPHRSRNLIEFWTRWHRTLGVWIRDYLYTPLLKSILIRWPKQGINLAFLCYFVAFFLAGVWHGANSNFAVYGLLHGVGVSAAKLWELLLTRRYGHEGLRRYLASRPIRWAATGLTMHYFFFTCIFFGLDLESCQRVFHRVVLAL